MSERFTFRLQKGTTIGGTIQDEAGRPIAGAEVFLLLSAPRAQRPRVHLWDHREVTDASGKWRCQHMPARADNVSIRLQHKDFISDDVYNQTPRPPIEQLRALTAVMVMKKGFTISGTVTDPNGKPVADALVAQGDDRFGSRYPSRCTDPQGQFSFTGCRPGDMVLTIAARGWAPELRTLTVGPNTGPVDVRLQAGHVIRVKVVDAEGKPVQGAWVAPDTWRGHRTLVDMGIPRNTNKDGIWTWDWAPADAILCAILKQDYADVRQRSLTAGDEVQVVKLHPPLVVSGKVIDAETKAPLPRFRYFRGIDYRNGGAVRWLRQETRESTTGDYQWKFSYPYPGILIRVEADGYEPGVSRVFTIDEGSVTLDFALKKAAGPGGTVVTAAGQPVANLEVMVCTRPLAISNGQLAWPESSNAERTRTDRLGKFTLLPQPEDFTVLLMDERGYVEVPGKRLQDPAAIILRPWARVEGILRIGSNPGRNERIVYYPDRDRATEKQFCNFYYQAQTDEDGRFVLERVQPGAGTIGREVRSSFGMSTVISTMSHGVRIELAAANITRVQIGGKGRPVTGRIALPPEFAGKKIAWANASATITQKRPSVPVAGNPKKALEGPAQLRTTRTYPVKVQPDGSFRVEDVEPGELHPSIGVSERAVDSQPGAPRVSGHFSKDFTLPAIPGGFSAEPFDLGNLPLEPSKP